MSFKKKYFGDKKFYMNILMISLPLILQQILLNSFGIIDTTMVGSVQDGIAGVGIGSQISTVVLTICFGINAGVSIFIAQFFGAKEEGKLRSAFLFGLSIVFAITLLATIFIFIFIDPIIGIFTDNADVITQAKLYTQVSIFTIIPSGLTYAFTFVYRNIQKTFVPLIISIITALVNFSLNYLLIKGNFGAPEMGVTGAAIGTLAAGLLGLTLHIIYAYFTKQIFFPKFKDFKTAFNISFNKKIFIRSLPLIINETLFAIGTSIYIVFINDLGSTQVISTAIYEGYIIAEKILSILMAVIFGFSTSVSAMVGKALGSRDLKRADDYGNWFLSLGFIISISLGIINLIVSPLIIPVIFHESSDLIISYARVIAIIYSVRIILRMFTVILYSTFRAGGKSFYVMCLDSLILWCVGIPIAFAASKLLNFDNVAFYFLALQIEGVIRIGIGIRGYLKRKWINNVVSDIKINNESQSEQT